MQALEHTRIDKPANIVGNSRLDNNNYSQQEGTEGQASSTPAGRTPKQGQLNVVYTSHLSLPNMRRYRSPMRNMSRGNKDKFYEVIGHVEPILQEANPTPTTTT